MMNEEKETPKNVDNFAKKRLKIKKKRLKSHIHMLKTLLLSYPQLFKKNKQNF